MLLSASVWTHAGLKILSGMSVEELVPAIRGSDLARLTRIPGVGRKTAERMVVEFEGQTGSRGDGNGKTGGLLARGNRGGCHFGAGEPWIRRPRRETAVEKRRAKRAPEILRVAAWRHCSR